eukprot:6016682-Amphidinium_carterae.1
MLVCTRLKNAAVPPCHATRRIIQHTPKRETVLFMSSMKTVRRGPGDRKCRSCSVSMLAAPRQCGCWSTRRYSTAR